MTRSESIANRLREVLLSGRWIANTNYKEQLLATTWQQATRKIGSLNTIAALTFHVNYYLAGLLQVLRGGKLEIRDRFSFDLPPINSENDWNRMVHHLLANAEQFADAVSHLPEEMLDLPLVEARYGTYQRNIDGLIEHCYYHLGQISLIRKMITESDQ